MLNQVSLIGRVGKDPEIKQFDNGNKVANFTLATSEKYKDKDGNKQEKTEWHSIAIWGKLADVVESYVKKGSLLYLSGKISYRGYESDGQKKYFTEIIASQMTMLGGNANANKEANDSQPANPVASDNGDDDLPF